MKKLLILILFYFAITAGVKAQTDVKVKKTATPVQTIHNAVHRHKHYKGYKVKKKYNDGHKTKKKVDTKTGEVEIKHN